MVNGFKQGGWGAVSLDITNNSEACSNVLVNPDVAMKTQVEQLLRETTKASASYDAIICVAGGFGCSNIKDDNIFEAYEEQDRINF